MANQPIGISFLPSAENQAQGPQRQGMEGGGGDLAQAWKILSLQLPRVLGARSLAPKRLLTGAGSAGMQGNPSAEVFKALLKAMLGGQSYLPTPESGAQPGITLPSQNPYDVPYDRGVPTPHFTPGFRKPYPIPGLEVLPTPINPPVPPAPSPLDPWGDFGGGTYGTEG